MTFKTINWWDKVLEKSRQEKEARELEQGYCDANLPPVMSGTIKGFLIKSTELLPNREWIDCSRQLKRFKWEIRWHRYFDDRSLEAVFKILDGVTGWEAYNVEDLIGSLDKEYEIEWISPCVGIFNRWDAMYINEPEMKNIIREFSKLDRFV